MISETLLVNPLKASLKLESLKQKAKITFPWKEAKEIHGLDDVYSEEDFLDFHVLTSNKHSVKLHTYREHGKNIPDIDRPRAIIISAHGLFAFQNTQASLAKFFSTFGITTLGFDFRGHGKSEGLPGLVESCFDLASDMIEFTTLIDKIYEKSIPRFYAGISMGGNLGFLVGLRIPNYFRGMILLAPALQANSLNKFSMIFARICTCLSVKIPIPPPEERLAARNPASAEKWMNDPLAYKGKVKLKTFASLMDSFDICKSNFKKFKVPFVVVIGGIDKLVDVEACVDFYEAAEIKDKTLLFAPDMWHVVPHEPEFPEILKFIGIWVEERINLENKLV